MSIDISKPIVWTTLGNMNECDLDQFDGAPCKISWQIVVDPENTLVIDHVVLVKEFYCKGTLVKREPHVLKLKGCATVAESATLQ